MKKYILLFFVLFIYATWNSYATDLPNTVDNMYSINFWSGAHIGRSWGWTTYIFGNTWDIGPNFYWSGGYFYWRNAFTMVIDNSVWKYYSSTWEYFCSYRRPAAYNFHFLTNPVWKYSVCPPTAIYRYLWVDYTEILENFWALNWGGQPYINTDAFISKLGYGALSSATGIATGPAGSMLYLGLGAAFLLAIAGLIILFIKWIK